MVGWYQLSCKSNLSYKCQSMATAAHVVIAFGRLCMAATFRWRSGCVACANLSCGLVAEVLAAFVAAIDMHFRFALSAGELWSLEKMLHTPLPSVRVSGSSKSKQDHDPDRQTHPTRVEEWPDWEREVKERLQQSTRVSLISSHTLSAHLQGC